MKRLSNPGRTRRDINRASPIIYYLTSQYNIQYPPPSMSHCKRVLFQACDRKASDFLSHIELLPCHLVWRWRWLRWKLLRQQTQGPCVEQCRESPVSYEQKHKWFALSEQQIWLGIILTSPQHGWGSSDAVAQCSCHTLCRWSWGTLSPPSHPSSTKKQNQKNKRE